MENDIEMRCMKCAVSIYSMEYPLYIRGKSIYVNFDVSFATRVCLYVTEMPGRISVQVRNILYDLTFKMWIIKSSRYVKCCLPDFLTSQTTSCNLRVHTGITENRAMAR